MKKARNADFFYEGGGRSKARSQLMHCARFSPGLILLTGDQGAGTSFLLKHIKQTFNQEEGDFCLISDETPILESEEDLYRAIATGFELDAIASEDVELLVEHVQQFVNIGLIEKRVMVIAVDDVQHHSMDVIDNLIQFVGGNKGLNLVLAGNADLLPLLKQFHIDNLVVHQINLRALLVEEVSEFISKAIQHNGEVVDFTPSSKVVNEVMATTGGNLALLGQEVQQLGFNEVAGEKRRAIGLPFAHIAAMVLVLTALLMVFIYYPNDNGANDDARVEAISLDVVEAQPEENSIKDSFKNDMASKTMLNQEQRLEEDGALGDSEDVSGVEVHQDDGVNEPKVDLERRANLESSDFAAGTDNTREEAVEVRQDVQPAKAAEQLSGEQLFSAEDEVKSDRIANTENQSRKDTDIARVENEKTQNKKAAPETSVATAMPYSRVEKTEHRSTSDKTPQKASIQQLRDFEKRLREFPASNYTLQLIGVSSREAAESYISQLAKPADLMGFYEKQLNGKPWFVVLYGNYPDRAEALAEAARFPGTQKPWARSLGDIHREIDSR